MQNWYLQYDGDGKPRSVCRGNSDEHAQISARAYYGPNAYAVLEQDAPQEDLDAICLSYVPLST